ncbi:A-kinase anchor protein 17A isoform X2 [Fopius arisanus]|nr:PREDICTED: A-kinase anchor protein 17A isoform X2 [Fopius arisanus]
MEKIRLLVRPDEFASLKVTKSTLEFVRLEGELTDRSRLQRILARLEGQRMNLAGFSSVLKVRAVEVKDEFPTKHSWDSYFRDAKHMNELKPGERPDTVHISGLPVKWFSEDGGKTPSESMVTRMFKKWGTIRRIDVPAADSYRTRMRLGNNIQKCSFGDGIFFDAYVQFIEYMDFVKLMDSLRGMKIMKKDGQNCLTAQIKVEFDKTKHMSDSSVAHREFERKRLIAQDNLAAEKLRRKEEAEVQKREEQKKKEAADKDAKESRRRKREEKRKRKALTMFRKQEEDKVSMKIAREERKLIKAQRQLESIRLLDELFDRIKNKVEKKEIIIGGTNLEDQKSGQKVEKGEEGTNKSADREDKKDKKNKKLKKKKSRKEKKRKKKSKKDSESSGEESDVETDKKKLRSALGSNNPNPMEMDPELGLSQMYPRFPQPWFYDAAAMLYPPMSRGGGGPMNRYQRGRGRIFPRRGSRYPRSMRAFNPHMYNEQYYKYFANLAGIDYYESDFNSKSRSCSRGRSSSRSRSRRRTRSRSYSRSRSRSRSRERRRRRRSASRSRSRSSRSRRSRSRRKSRSESRSRSRESKRHSRRKRSRSKIKVSRARSKSTTPKRKSRSRSWSMPKSPRQRSCSWSKNVDEAAKGTEGKKTTCVSETADISKEV